MMIYVSFFPLQIPIYFEFLALTRYEFNAMKAKDYEKASEAVLLSLAARQNPARYQRVAKVIKSGERRHFQE
ncbi:MAG: hypothetical protein V6Z81_06585 [Parvularculales bacterium]